mgnify:CR=1 FL=1
MNRIFSNISKGQILVNVATLIIVAGMLIVNRVIASPNNSIVQQEATISQLSYQGLLLDSTDNPLSGTFDVTFTIYDHPTEAAQLWEEEHIGVNAIKINDGLLTVTLGSLIPIPTNIWNYEELYLGIQIGNDLEMSPREQINLLPPRITTGSLDASVLTAYSITRDLFPSYTVNYDPVNSVLSSRNNITGISFELDPATCQANDTWCCDNSTSICVRKNPDGEDILAIRMEESHSTACWLVHDDDDNPMSSEGISFATDGGTGAGDAWQPFYPDGNGFFFMRDGANNIPIANYSSYQIVCFN